MKPLAKYSMGVGDRFGQQGRAQLEAFRLLLQNQDVLAVPVWNKSNREHTLIGTQPDTVRQEADQAVSEANWRHPFHVDADHINLGNVDRFIAASDFFTLDVADFMGQAVAQAEVDDFVSRHTDLIGNHAIGGLPEPVVLTRSTLEEIVRDTLLAVQQAGVIYRHIVDKKGSSDFITEVSMDETVHPQTPEKLLVILAALSDERIPVQTIAPKFTGHFNKGVDYAGDPTVFAAEFDADACVVKKAIQWFGLPPDLKLSIHSGSDKFSLYPFVARTLKERQVGVHVKTAGTSWLEEVAGLAASGEEGLSLAKQIYAQALPRFQELIAPYATVIDIHAEQLPSIRNVDRWDCEQFVRALRHVPDDPLFNADFRQFFHVSFRVAAEMGDRYREALRANAPVVSRFVTENIYERHLLSLFGGLSEH